MTDLGLPENILACLFDLDGVITRTAVVHAAAWKETFDAFLRERDGAGFRPSTPTTTPSTSTAVRVPTAYAPSRLPGRRTARGEPGDPPDAPTVHGLGNRKNELLLERIRAGGVDAYEGTLRYIEAVRARRLRTAVVSASANCLDVLRAIGAEHLFDVRVDGVVAAERGLPGKPRPDTFLAAARDLGVPPGRAAVFEDALAGMDAGRAGHFGYVVGVDRVGRPQALYAHGADRVVTDLEELLGEPGERRPPRTG
ncbi:HAD family hydrolase [Streptomyces sp. INA 01156]